RTEPAGARPGSLAHRCVAHRGRPGGTCRLAAASRLARPPSTARGAAQARGLVHYHAEAKRPTGARSGIGGECEAGTRPASSTPESSGWRLPRIAHAGANNRVLATRIRVRQRVAADADTHGAARVRESPLTIGVDRHRGGEDLRRWIPGVGAA